MSTAFSPRPRTMSDAKSLRSDTPFMTYGTLAALFSSVRPSTKGWSIYFVEHLFSCKCRVPYVEGEDVYSEK